MENIDKTMETVTMDKRKIVWMGAYYGWRFVEEIYNMMGDASEEEKLHHCADIYATCATQASWEQLNAVLYSNAEMEAAKKAKAFIQEKGE